MRCRYLFRILIFFRTVLSSQMEQDLTEYFFFFNFDTETILDLILKYKHVQIVCRLISQSFVAEQFLFLQLSTYL